MKFYNFHRIRPALDQFISGLNTCNIYGLMVDNPAIFRDIMCSDKPMLTSAVVQDFFEVSNSEIGSSKRDIENRILAFFRDYVLDCEGRV